MPRHETSVWVRVWTVLITYCIANVLAAYGIWKSKLHDLFIGNSFGGERLNLPIYVNRIGLGFPRVEVLVFL